ncbi:aldehyde reductase [Devosia sp. A8/3-2]|nr:aldehyde reductase [Devosia sp. A8/3-2]
MSDRVLLTGISGFLGGHIALQLLAAGYTVRGSVRSLDKADKVRQTLSKAGADITELEFVALDLLKDDGWAAAMADCRYLQHTASPFVLRTPKDPGELIRPAVEGTRRAISAALAANVERIVLTSSIAAMQYGHDNYERLLTEADWTNLDSPQTPAYPRSKTTAEQQARAPVDAAGRHDDLAVINPAAILGPLLDEDPGTSAMMVQLLLDGKLPAVPAISIAIVDVRDVVALHLAAMTDPAAGGQRCVAAVETVSMAQLGQFLKPAFPNRRIPTRTLPDWLVRIVGLFNHDIGDNVAELGSPKRFNTHRAPTRPGRPLIPASEAAIATGKSPVEHGLV